MKFCFVVEGREDVYCLQLTIDNVVQDLPFVSKTHWSLSRTFLGCTGVRL